MTVSRHALRTLLDAETQRREQQLRKGVLLSLGEL